MLSPCRSVSDEGNDACGEPLSELEKVKNYLLYLASKLELKEHPDMADRIKSTWAAIFLRLMANGCSGLQWA